MTVRPPGDARHAKDGALAWAEHVADATGAAATWDAWLAQDRDDPTGPGPRRNPKVPPRLMLVLHLVAVLTGVVVSWTSLLDLLALGLTEDQRAHLGHPGMFDPDDLRLLRAAAHPGSDTTTRRAAHRTWQRLYNDFYKSVETVFAPLRWDWHPRNKAMTNAAHHAHTRALTPDQVARADRNRDRLETVCNLLLAASVWPHTLDGYRGDLFTDEVVLRVAQAHGAARGVGPDERRAGNPSAVFFVKKDAPETAGWSLGATFVGNARRPGDPPTPSVFLGMHVGDATGGRVHPVVTGLRHATANGLVPPRAPRAPHRLLFADMGYTKLDGLHPQLLAHGYRVVQEEGERALPWRHLEGPTRKAAGPPGRDTANRHGAVVRNGQPICPGGNHLPTLAQLPDGATPDQRDAHRRLQDLLQAHTMRPNSPPTPAAATSRGRPRAGATPPDLLRLELVCPAAAGTVRCALYDPGPEADPREQASLPETIPPPAAHRPNACKTRVSTALVTPDVFKWLQPHLMYGDHWTRLYRGNRQANEQYHEQFRAREGGGVDERFARTVSSERLTVLVACAIAVCNENTQRRHELGR